MLAVLWIIDFAMCEENLQTSAANGAASNVG